MHSLHFLRPYWWLAILPWLWLAWLLWQKNPKLQGWEAVCDKHLLAHLVQKNATKKLHFSSWLWLLLSLLFIIMSLTGPTWSRLPVPAYQPAEARVFLLSLSDMMLEKDILPDRLSRAKFTLKDIFERKDVGQFGMIAYTDEPFVVSPLTEDGLTINALLPSLTPEIMPVQGNNLSTALEQAVELINQAGFTQGNILVLTSQTPSQETIDLVKKMAESGIYSSILALNAANPVNTLFTNFAAAGHGELLPYSPSTADLDHWLSRKSNRMQFNQSKDDLIPVWRDQGRWFLFPALLFLLPVFRRGWLQRIEL
jgi:Ca-activated chloride channel family protein